MALTVEEKPTRARRKQPELEEVTVWAFVNESGFSGLDDSEDFPITGVGQRFKVSKSAAPRFCAYGLDKSSKSPLDALDYAGGAIVCRLRLRGTFTADRQHFYALEAEVLQRADATKLLHSFACLVAEQALLRERAAGREPDPRLRAAIEAKRAWLRGEIDDLALDAARRRRLGRR
jgi:hypothetical protein